MGAAILSKLKLFKVNLILFLIISAVISLIAEKIPKCFYSYDKWLFKERDWERGGRFYEKFFYVKKWKCRLPEISDFVKSRFAKKHLKNNSRTYITTFLTESCKSEFTHWAIIFSSFLFLLWSDAVSMLSIFFIAIILNLPYIIIQRYNRPRLIRLLRKNSVREIGFSAETARAHA